MRMLKCGDNINLDGKLLRVIGLEIDHEELANTIVTLANRSRDITSEIANLMDMQRIEMAYAQGSPTFFTETINGNAAHNNALVMFFHIPLDLRIVNEIRLDVIMDRFRIDTHATQGGGERVETLPPSATRTSGASTTVTTESSNNITSGASSMLTSGPSSLATSHSSPAVTPFVSHGLFMHPASGPGGGFHTHVMGANGQNVYMAHAHGSDHNHILGPNHNTNHTHGIPHEHTMYHTHNMAHTHSVVLPNHTHAMRPNMLQWALATNNFVILINGVQRVSSTAANRTWSGDITNWLLDTQGNLQRNFRHRIEVRPTAGFAHFSQMVSVQGYLVPRNGETL